MIESHESSGESISPPSPEKRLCVETVRGHDTAPQVRSGATPNSAVTSVHPAPVHPASVHQTSPRSQKTAPRQPQRAKQTLEHRETKTYPPRPSPSPRERQTVLPKKKQPNRGPRRNPPIRTSHPREISTEPPLRTPLGESAKNFFESNTAGSLQTDSRTVLVMTEVGGSRDAALMIRWMLGVRGEVPPTQIAHFQGRTELQEEGNLSLLIDILAPPTQGPLWSLNLGEIPFSLTQLVRIKEALSGPTCAITHIFMEQLSQEYPKPTHSSAAGRDAQVEADRGNGSPWANILRALIRAKAQQEETHQVSGLRRRAPKRCHQDSLQHVVQPFEPRQDKTWLAVEKLSRASRACTETLKDDHPHFFKNRSLTKGRINALNSASVGGPVLTL